MSIGNVSYPEYRFCLPYFYVLQFHALNYAKHFKSLFLECCDMVKNLLEVNYATIIGGVTSVARRTNFSLRTSKINFASVSLPKNPYTLFPLPDISANSAPCLYNSDFISPMTGNLSNTVISKSFTIKFLYSEEISL